LANVGMWARHARSLGNEGVVSTTWASYDTVNPPCEPLPTADLVPAAPAALYRNADTPVALPQWCQIVESGTVHQLRALGQSTTDPLVRAYAQHRLLTIATEEVAQTAAWQRAVSCEDPAASASRIMADASVDGLIGQWRAWQAEYAAAIGAVYAGAGSTLVAAAKAAEPIRRLSGLR
jgi:hexosaminidase